MKRQREEDPEALDTANCLMLLSRIGLREYPCGSAYTCKTCDRGFPSFQALGGHRASHKKLIPSTSSVEYVHVPEAKAHDCSICGISFLTGQALGGHMRRHRNEIMKKPAAAPRQFLMLKKSTAEKKRDLCLDLKLSSFGNNLRLAMGKISSCTVDLAL